MKCRHILVYYWIPTHLRFSYNTNKHFYICTNHFLVKFTLFLLDSSKYSSRKVTMLIPFKIKSRKRKFQATFNWLHSLQKKHGPRNKKWVWIMIIGWHEQNSLSKISENIIFTKIVYWSKWVVTFKVIRTFLNKLHFKIDFLDGLQNIFEKYLIYAVIRQLEIE